LTRAGPRHTVSCRSAMMYSRAPRSCRGTYLLDVGRSSCRLLQVSSFNVQHHRYHIVPFSQLSYDSHAARSKQPTSLQRQLRYSDHLPASHRQILCPCHSSNRGVRSSHTATRRYSHDSHRVDRTGTVTQGRWPDSIPYRLRLGK